MLKKFTDYRILKSRNESLLNDYQRELSEIVMRENIRKSAGYIGNNIEVYMRPLQNCSREAQSSKRHEYERMIFEQDKDGRKKWVNQQYSKKS